MNLPARIFSLILLIALAIGLAPTVQADESASIDAPALREILKGAGVKSLDPKPDLPEAKVKLGQALFFGTSKPLG